MEKVEYPKCYQCGCQIGLTDINGTYVCHRCMKELKKYGNMASAIYRSRESKNIK